MEIPSRRVSESCPKKKTKVKTDKKKSLLIEMLYYFLKSWTGDSALVFLYQ